MPKKLTYQEVESYYNSFGYELLTTEYINNKTKLITKCPIGHVFEMLFNSFKNGYRCPICSKKKKKTIEEIKEYIESQGYQLLSKEYINSNTKLKLLCNKGHYLEMTWGNYQHGYRCPICCGVKKKTIEEIKEYTEKQGYQLLSKEYIGAHKKLVFQCDKSHIFKMEWAAFQQGQRCPKCSESKQISIGEKDTYSFVKKIYSGIILTNDKKTITNPNTKRQLELDILMPEIMKAIEYGSPQWHDKPKVIIRDKIKIEQCKKLGIKLLTICEHNWKYSKERCEDNIRKFILD